MLAIIFLLTVCWNKFTGLYNPKKGLFKKDTLLKKCYQNKLLFPLLFIIYAGYSCGRRTESKQSLKGSLRYHITISLLPAVEIFTGDNMRYNYSNYCNSNSCRSFTLLKALAKSNGNLFAIAFKSEKEQQLLLSL